MKIGTRLLLPAHIQLLKYDDFWGRPLGFASLSSNIDQIWRLKYDDFWGNPPGFACLSSKINEFTLKSVLLSMFEAVKIMRNVFYVLY